MQVLGGYCPTFGLVIMKSGEGMENALLARYHRADLS
jgi:hypothetical protein